MASLFVKHTVADYNVWKPIFDEHASERSKYGITGHSLHRDAQEPNTIIIAMRASNLARAQEFASSDDLREVMMKAGVQGMPEIWFAEDVEDKTYT